MLLLLWCRPAAGHVVGRAAADTGAAIRRQMCNKHAPVASKVVGEGWQEQAVKEAVGRKRRKQAGRQAGRQPWPSL